MSKPAARDTLDLAAELAAIPVGPGDLDAVTYYDGWHTDGRPWRFRGVSPEADLYRVRLLEPLPWGGKVRTDLAGRFPTERAAAAGLVRYLRWRHGPDHWRPDADKPAAVETFDDNLDPNLPASWVGRLWVNGVPELVFADAASEAGFAYPGEAAAAAKQLARVWFGADWRRWLCRCRRPWITGAVPTRPEGVLS